MMKDKYTFIDLDGVILDSEQRVLEKRSKQNELTWDEFFEKLDWYTLLKESCQINNSLDILLELQSRKDKIAILTKVHTILEAQAKLFELRENRKITIPIFIVPPHFKKSDIYYPSKGEILVDDSLKNIKSWNENNGKGILFCEDQDLINNKTKSLEFLLKKN